MISPAAYFLLLVTSVDRDDRVRRTGCEEEAVRVERQARHGADALAQEAFVVADERQLLAVALEYLDELVVRATVRPSNKAIRTRQLTMSSITNKPMNEPAHKQDPHLAKIGA